MTVEIRRGSTRFVEREHGRVTRHSFSFGADYDPARLGFGPMVCHDDHLLGPGRGFDTHRHSGLEIVTYVVSGSLRHADSIGAVTVVPAGSVAVLSASVGVEHSEFATDDQPCRFVQAWLRTDSEAASRYDVRGAAGRAGELVPVADPLPGAVLHLARLGAGVPLTLPPAPLLHAYVVTGALLRSSLAEPLSAGDAFEMTDEPSHEVSAGVPTELLVWTFTDVRGPTAAHDSETGEQWDPPVGRLRLMGDYGGPFLWDEEGALPWEYDYYRLHLGVSRGLYDDLVQWGTDWDGRQSGSAEHDARGRALLERLRAGCPAYEFELRL